MIDLAARLPEIKDMLSRSLRGDIDIRLGVPRRPCAVKVDPNEFELALLNLAFNARDAMPSGGTLTISAKPVVMRGKSTEEGLSGEFVAVRIADTGTGIPPEVLPRVFEPFFTTKDVGKGTGLGLSQVYGFARQSGGAASIATSARRGTAVTLFLPRSFEAPAQPRRNRQPPPSRRRPAPCSSSKTMPKSPPSRRPISSSSATRSATPRARRPASIFSPAKPASIWCSPTF